MRKVQKFGAAAVMAGVIAIGMTTFATPVHASGSAPTKSAVCAQIESAEAALNASTNPFVKKYLQIILAGLEKLEVLLGGCAS